ARTVTLSGTINANSIVFNDPSTSYDSFWTLDSGTLNLLGSALIDPRGNNNYRINSIITGTSGLLLDTTSGSRNGNSETRLAGNNTYTGITKIYDSTLAAYHSNAFGATGTGNHTEIYANGRAFIAGTNGTSTPITVSEDIYLKATNTTAIRSSNANNILAGNIVNFVNAASGNDVGINVGTNNTFTITGNISSAALGGASYYTRTILSAGAGATSKIIVSGSISNNPDGTITKLLIDGSSTGSNSGTIELTGNNSFTGEIVIRRGTLLLSSENAVGNSAGIIFADGGLSDSTNTLRLLTNGAYTISQNISLNIASGSNTYTAVIGGNSAHSSTYSGNITINDTNASTYQLTAAEGGTVTFSGLINDGANSKAISKIGGGTVVLSRGAGNTYDGGTTVTAGTLSIANTSGSATGTGNVTVNSGATLAGYGTIGGANVTINGAITPDGTITLSNTAPTLAFGNGAQVNFDLGSTSDKITFTNPGILSGSGNADLNLTLGTGFSYSNTYTIFENFSTNDFSFKSINGYDNNVYQAILAKDGNNYVLSFTQIKFFVTYDGNTNTGGTPPTDSNSYSPGANVTVLGKNTLVKDGYKFVCWNTAPNASGTSLYPGGTFEMSANNLTLYAIWEYIPQWTVTFQTDPSGITLIGETPQIVSDEQDCSPVTAIAPKGYRFQKWLKDGYDYSNANSITVTYVKSNMNFTAVFIKKCGIYDFNADDKADVLSESLSGTSAGNGNIYLMNPSGFAYLPPTSASLYSKSDLNWQVAKFADLTGDKRCDLLWRHTGTGKVILYTTKESGLEINPGIVIYSGGAWTPVDSTDFNNDGKEDILWKYADTTTAKYMVNFMNGVSVIGSKSISKGSTDWEIVKVADFNGDSSEDALYMSKTTKTGIVYFLDRGNLLGTAKVFEKGAGWDIKAVGDFDANGAADILLESTDGKTGFIILLKNRLTDGNSGVKNSGIAYFKSDVNWKLLQTGDFNNDGKDDLLWENATTGQGMIWVMNGMTASSTKIIYTLSVVDPATKWTVIKLLDFNADGKADILWEKADTRKALVYLMDGATLKATGKVYTPADNTWKVLNP
ncbi:MAG: FG-GAP-like repeat-containing protein, partial [Candidatus Nanoarchaeia archaeon]